MKKNLGLVDRAIRGFFTLVALVLLFTGWVSGFWDIIMGVIALFGAFTAITGFSPLYRLVGLKTCTRIDQEIK